MWLVSADRTCGSKYKSGSSQFRYPLLANSPPMVIHTVSLSDALTRGDRGCFLGESSLKSRSGGLTVTVI